jgi:hypothetical protein
MEDLEKVKGSLQILYRKIIKWNLYGLYMEKKEIRIGFNKQRNQYGLPDKIKNLIIQWAIMTTIIEMINKNLLDKFDIRQIW